MAKCALWVMIEAKTGKEAEVAEFLKAMMPLVEAEAGTLHVYVLDLGGGRFGVCDTFDDEAARQAHLNGEAAKAVMGKAEELFAKPPFINLVEILASK